MPASRVLIISSQTLFAEALGGLLQRHGYSDISVQPYDDGIPLLVAATQPSVIILDVRGVPPSATAALLDCAENIRILQVSLDSHLIATYERRQASATVAEFLELVRLAEDGPTEDQDRTEDRRNLSDASEF